ncbi:MAG: DUF3364 domain-containing protein [Ferrovum myxofaciens]
MTQNSSSVLDHFNLFREPEYLEMFENKKKNFENSHPKERVEEIREWTKTWEYREKNFDGSIDGKSGEGMPTVGAVFVAVGFEGTMPFVHGSQGCVAYYRSHLSRHLHGAVILRFVVDDGRCGGIWGLNNMIDGLSNTTACTSQR